MANFIVTIIELESTVELCKIHLLENHLFDPFVAFQYLDQFGQGYATKADILAFFDSYGVSISDQELDYLIYFKGRAAESKTHLTRTDCLFYDNFLKILTPATSNALSENLSAKRDRHAGRAHMLPSYVFNQFLALLDKEIQIF